MPRLRSTKPVAGEATGSLSGAIRMEDRIATGIAPQSLPRKSSSTIA